MPLPSAQLESLVRLSLVQGIGPHRFARLIEHFGSADRAVAARITELRSLPGVGPDLSARIKAADSPLARRQAAAALRLLERMEVTTIYLDDPAYPSAFLDIPDRPYLLYCLGDTSLLRVPALAVVGTRSPSAYGRKAASDLSRELASRGFVIVSGMARGIDRAAHEGALAAGGATIGVLGHGIDQVYPPESRGLFREVRMRGLILTEYPPGETPRPGNFPRRNRLITALSQAVLVVEMGLKSGAQHTVGYALDQGKEVLAVPGPIGSTASEGTNQLIKDGARMVTCADDVLEELYGIGTDRVEHGFSPTRPCASSSSAPLPELAILAPGEERLLQALSADPAPIDVIARNAGTEASEALVVLLELELRGLVAAHPGMRYARC